MKQKKNERKELIPIKREKEKARRGGGKARGGGRGVK